MSNLAEDFLERHQGWMTKAEHAAALSELSAIIARAEKAEDDLRRLATDLLSPTPEGLERAMDQAANVLGDEAV